MTHILAHCLNVETQIFNTCKKNLHWPFAYNIKSKDKKVLVDIKACCMQNSNLCPFENNNKNVHYPLYHRSHAVVFYIYLFMSAMLNESAFGGHKSETRSRLKISPRFPFLSPFFMGVYSSPYLWEKRWQNSWFIEREWVYIYFFGRSEQSLA